MLGDGIVIRPRSGGNSDAVRGGGGHVHGVIADADARDDAQLRVCGDDASGVGFGAGERGVDAVEGGKNLVFHHLVVNA
jgi:hypothetical protein